jgi:hypothetical protein
MADESKENDPVFVPRTISADVMAIGGISNSVCSFLPMEDLEGLTGLCKATNEDTKLAVEDITAASWLGITEDLGYSDNILSKLRAYEGIGGINNVKLIPPQKVSADSPYTKGAIVMSSMNECLIYDMETDSIEKLPKRPHSQSYISCMNVDSRGMIVIGESVTNPVMSPSVVVCNMKPDGEGKKKKRRLKNMPFSQKIQSIAMLPNNTILIGEESLYTVNMETGVATPFNDEPKGPLVIHLRVLPDGGILAVRRSGDLKIYNMDGSERKSLPNDASLSFVDCTMLTDKILICTVEKSLRFWNIESGKIVHSIPNVHRNIVTGITRLKGNYFATVDIRGILKIWNKDDFSEFSKAKASINLPKMYTRRNPPIPITEEVYQKFSNVMGLAAVEPGVLVTGGGGELQAMIHAFRALPDFEMLDVMKSTPASVPTLPAVVETTVPVSYGEAEGELVEELLTDEDGGGGGSAYVPPTEDEDTSGREPTVGGYNDFTRQYDTIMARFSF